MANVTIGHIEIEGDHNTHFIGDFILVSYDPAITQYTVTETLAAGGTSVVTPPYAGIFLFPSDSGIRPNYSRGDRKVEIITGVNTITYFTPIESWPFWQTKTRSIIDGGVNDVLLGVDTITSATTNTADGAVVLSASGTNNTSFTYSKNGGAYQASATFSGLYAGDYFFSVKDDQGNIASIDVTVPVDTLPIENTTHGVKYRADFLQHRPGATTDQIKHRIEILERDYGGAVDDTVVLGETPIVINIKAEGSDYIGDAAIVGHDVSISFISETLKEYIDFGLGDDYKYMVLYYMDDSVAKDGSDYNVRFKGFITPETYSENYGDFPYSVTFSATDRLADLQNIPFYESSTFDENLRPKNVRVKGILKQAIIIDKCLKNVRMNQGYRIAINMFDAGMNSTSTDTPIHQAFEDCESFYNKNSAGSCAAVIKKLLRPYGAILFSWNNFFYIVKEEQLRTTTLSYVEFATIGGAASSGTFTTPRVSFKSAGSTNLFRYMGNQSLSLTRAIKTININSVGKIKEGGTVSGLNANNVSYDEKGNFLGFGGFELVVNDQISSRPYRENILIDTEGQQQAQLFGEIIGWTLKYAENYNDSSSYIRLSKSVTYTKSDKMKISFKIQASGGFEYLGGHRSTDAPYFVMKWALKVGSYYLLADGTWSLTEGENQFFIIQEDIINGTFVEFVLEPTFRDTLNSTPITDDYELKIFPISIWEYDIESTDQSDALSDMEALSVASLEPGTRRILRYTNSGQWYYNYFELRAVLDATASKSNLTEIKPTSSTIRRWFLVSSWSRPNDYDSDNVLQSTMNIKDFKIETLPGGEKPPTEFGEMSIISYDNNLSLDISLENFDLTSDVNNDKNIYMNYTRLSNGNPTTVWNRTTGVALKARQSHLLDRLYELYKTPRYKINSSFYCDLELSLLNHLYDFDDDGRIFALTGGEINPKTGQHSGEILEIYQDNTPTRGEFDTSFDIDNEYA